MKNLNLIFLFVIINAVSVNNIYSQNGWISQNIGNNEFLSIQFPTKNDTGFIVSNYELIIKTTNGGNVWFTQSSGSTIIGSGFFTSSSLGSVWGIYPMLTTNGGLAWSQMSIHLNTMGQTYHKAISFINNTTGYVIGGDYYPVPIPCCYDGIINKSTNAGSNWVEVYRQGGDIFQELYFKDENNGIILDQIALVSTSDGGQNWYRNNRIFYDVRYFFTRSMTDPFKDTIFIAGIKSGFGADTGAVIKSTDNGNSWFYSIQLPYSSRLRKICFLDNMYGYAVGDTGLIIKTTNGGENWTVLNSGTRKRLNGVSFINKDTGFVVGDSGLVLTTFTGGLTDINSEIDFIPNSFTLNQNYPNPFNPLTTISFSLPKRENVILKVYDISGKEIITLMNEVKTSGNYSAVFDASDLSSGVYFYELAAGDFKAVRKMVVVK